MMRRALKRGLKRMLASEAGWRSIGTLLRDRGVMVVTYHRVLGEDRRLSGISVEAFTAQMRWLREHCEPIAPADFVSRVGSPRSRRPPVLVTFDDGYRDYHDLAHPVLKALGIPAVCSSRRSSSTRAA
jgi:hypothetical protein